MHFWRRTREVPPTETVGRVVVTYNPGQTGPTNLAVVRSCDYDRLANVIQAYQQIVTLQGRHRAHPNEHTRQDTRELLGLPRPKLQPTERRPFPLQTYTIAPGRRGRPATLAAAGAMTLSPWRMRSAQLTSRQQVAALADK